MERRVAQIRIISTIPSTAGTTVSIATYWGSVLDMV